MWSEDLLDPLNVNGSVLVDLYFSDTPDVPYKVVNIIIILLVQIFFIGIGTKSVGKECGCGAKKSRLGETFRPILR